MSAQLLAEAEHNGDLDLMCKITADNHFSFETVFRFISDHRIEQREITPVLTQFLLWLLDRIDEDATLDKGDYILQTIDIAVQYNNRDFFATVVEHPCVGISAWPMMGVCSRRNFDLMEVLFDLYDDEHLTVLSDFMLKSNLQEGVREHLQHNILRKQSQRQAKHISQNLEDISHSKKSTARKI